MSISGSVTQTKYDELARFQGFKDEVEMLSCLSKEWTIKAIADLLGYDIKTIMKRLHTHHIDSVCKRKYPNRYRWRV